MNKCRSNHLAPQVSPSRKLKQENFQRIVDSILRSNQAKHSVSQLCHKFSGIQLYVEAPCIDLYCGVAAGYLDQSRVELITTKNPFRIASNSKTFVAAAILRLWEDQHVLLDGAISQYLSSDSCGLIENHGYFLDRITPRHLLSHTSGLFDYADSRQFQSALIERPQYRWSRIEQLQLAMEFGKPYGKPGEVYRYSDTGYILLGEIIERISGQSLGMALRGLLDYEGLGLSSTYWEILEQEPIGLPAKVHQYVDDRDFNDQDASCDIYGGGGLVSTVEDLTHFIRALFNDEVFTYSRTIKEMLATVAATRGGPAAYDCIQQIPGTYRLGIEAGGSGSLYGHAGYLGTYAGYIPARDVAFSFSMNQHYISDEKHKLITEILRLFGVDF